MSDPVADFMARLEQNNVLHRRIELAFDSVGFEAGHKEIVRIAKEEGVPLTDAQVDDVLDRLSGS